MVKSALRAGEQDGLNFTEVAGFDFTDLSLDFLFLKSVQALTFTYFLYILTVVASEIIFIKNAVFFGGYHEKISNSNYDTQKTLIAEKIRADKFLDKCLGTGENL